MSLEHILMVLMINAIFIIEGMQTAFWQLQNVLYLTEFGENDFTERYFWLQIVLVLLCLIIFIF
jgi:hypothetical protein